ncbi:MAG: hypothetical protein ACKVQV_14185 [Bacteroidia bacterium]
MTKSAGDTFLYSLKQLFIALLKLATIAFAWLCKISGMILIRTGEMLEKIVSK